MRRLARGRQGALAVVR